MKKRYADVAPMNIVNLPKVRDWFDGHGDRYLGFDRVQTIMNDNRPTLARIYGKRHQTFTSEFRFDVWRIPYDGLYFWVLSAKAKGTGIEVEAPDVWKPDYENVVISFLTNLYNEIKDIEDND